MHFIAKVLLVVGLLLAPMAQAGGEWTLESAKAAFSHHKAEDNCVSILHDGWQITFLAHDGKEIGGVIVIAQKDAEDHEYDLEETVTRIAGLVGMDSPEAVEFEEEDSDVALLLDQTVLGNLVEETEDVFDGSPLAAMAYLLDDGYFVLHSVRDNGYLHWKTAKKSGVELLMPMTQKKLQAIEVIGRQEMNEFASEVLAEKLGMGGNTVQPSSRQALCSELRCRVVPYMNAKSNELLARTDRRAVIGKRQAVGQMLASRRYAEVSYPAESSDWPEESEDEAEEESEDTETDEEMPAEDEEAETGEEMPAEDETSDTSAAREAYIDYLRSL